MWKRGLKLSLLFAISGTFVFLAIGKEPVQADRSQIAVAKEVADRATQVAQTLPTPLIRPAMLTTVTATPTPSLTVKNNDAMPQPDPYPKALQAAKLRQEQIFDKQTSVTNSLDAMVASLDLAIASIRVDDSRSQTDALLAFAPLVGRLNELATQLNTRRERLVEASDDLDSALSDAPTVFRDAAALYREYAAAESYDEIKRDYELLAESWETIAVNVEDHAAEVAPNRDELNDVLEYVRATSTFLGRLDQHLQAYGNGAGLKRADYLSRLREYARGYEQLRQRLQDFHRRLRGDAAEPNVPEKSASKTSGSSTNVRVVTTSLATEVRRVAPSPAVSATKPLTPVNVDTEPLGRITRVNVAWGRVLHDDRLQLATGQIRPFYGANGAKGSVYVSSHQHNYWFMRIESGSPFVTGDSLTPALSR